MKRFWLVGVALLSAACSRNIQNTDAVHAAVVEYLNARAAQTGLNMAQMEVQITTLAFERDQARAGVAFRLKDGNDGGGMQMSYTLDRKGNKWVVRGRQDGANPHGAGGALPGALPGGLPGDPGAGGMPPGHPVVGSGDSGGPKK